MFLDIGGNRIMCEAHYLEISGKIQYALALLDYVLGLLDDNGWVFKQEDNAEGQYIFRVKGDDFIIQTPLWYTSHLREAILALGIRQYDLSGQGLLAI